MISFRWYLLGISIIKVERRTVDIVLSVWYISSIETKTNERTRSRWFEEKSWWNSFTRKQEFFKRKLKRWKRSKIFGGFGQDNDQWGKSETHCTNYGIKLFSLSTAIIFVHQWSQKHISTAIALLIKTS